MTERDAWLYLAQVWDGARKSDLLGDGAWCVELYGYTSYGLCVSVAILGWEHRISTLVEKKMEAKIPCKGIEYMFPTDEEGAKRRVGFCLERAVELTTNA